MDSVRVVVGGQKKGVYSSIGIEASTEGIEDESDVASH